MTFKCVNYLSLLICGALSSALLMTAVPAEARTYIRVAPPAVRVEKRPPAPRRGYVWVGGYYRWNGNRYIWIPGRWVAPPRAGAVWIPGRWVRVNQGWYWVDGRW
jgi:hypothetical protein